MGFDASGVGVDEDISRLDSVVLRHTHLAEDVFDGCAHVVNFDMDGNVMWDVESFEQSDLPFAYDFLWDGDRSTRIRLSTPHLDLIESKVYKRAVQNRG